MGLAGSRAGRVLGTDCGSWIPWVTSMPATARSYSSATRYRIRIDRGPFPTAGEEGLAVSVIFPAIGLAEKEAKRYAETTVGLLTLSWPMAAVIPAGTPEKE